MEEQRTEYIQAQEYERTNDRKSQRNEKNLLASMLEMYVSGVTTRKVSKVVETLCGNLSLNPTIPIYFRIGIVGFLNYII